jgi:glycosyltransferase involved in cell wall biosynthesis
MKIALTTDSFIEGKGGISTAVAALARSLRQRGHQVIVYTAADPSHKNSDLDVVGFRALRYERFPGGRAPLAPIALTQELADFNPDIIHNHSMATMGIQSLATSSLLGVPIVGTCHVFLAGFLKYAPISLEGIPFSEEAAWKFTTVFFNRFPHVTTPSEAMRLALISHGLHVPVSAISNGVDTQLFSDKKISKSINEHQLTLLHTGRLSYEKQVDVVIRAFARLLPDHPKTQLIIVGEGPEQPILCALVANLGISKSVEFAGFVSHDQLPVICSEADVFVTASSIETQGLVVLEAMACGLPVVGVNALAIPDLVKHDRNGLLVPPDDEVSLADAISRLLNEPYLRQAMGRKSRELALSHSMSEIANSYESIYLELLQKPPRRLLPKRPKVLAPSDAWEAFQAERQALKDAGVEQTYEILALLQEWSGKVISLVKERVRNGFRSQSSEKQSDHHDVDLSE